MATGSASAAPHALVSRGQELILPLAVIASVLVIMVPLPTGLMDVLLAANITVAVIVLLTTIYVRTPLEFSIFPSLLLATTLARLVLNVATTRLILTRAASDGDHAAGGVITAFSDFVAGDGAIVVGLIIFTIIVVIQFVVITKGATRISEVAARFALDGMPGKQMAIDADLGAGIIDQTEAQRRRAEIAQQADFYGAMDGASKFVRGDAVAGVVITLVNIVGGLVIGVGQQGMSFGHAGSLFTRLTIGDGLVSQLPAFLISLAAGLLITRSARQTNLPSEFLQQLFSRPQALAVTGGFLAILVFTSLPAVPLVALGAACLGLSWTMTRRQADERAAVDQAREKQSRSQERVEDFLTVDPLMVELGVDLIRLADPNRGGDLLDRVRHVRENLASQLGLVMPKVRVRDNLELGPNQYRIKIAEMPVAQGELSRDDFFAEPTVFLAENLAEVCRRHADEILTRDATKHLVDQLKSTSPAVVDELIPAVMTLAEVQAVLQLLLREQVSIRQLGLILETLSDHAPRSKSPLLLAESVRQRLARQLSTEHRSADGELHVVTLEPDVEDCIFASLQNDERRMHLGLSPQTVETICQGIGSEIEKLSAANRTPIVLVSAEIRAAVKQLTESYCPDLTVLSFSEITRDTKVVTVGSVRGTGR